MIEMANTVPYLIIKGGAKKAIKLYKSIFGAEIISHMPYDKKMGKEMGFPEDFDYENSTMHAHIEIDGAPIYLADDLAGFGDEKVPRRGTGRVEIMLDVDSKNKFDKIWEKASKRRGFKVIMPAEKTFWGAWYCRFIDSKKIGWQINFQIPEK
jgi:PhnB protein